MLLEERQETQRPFLVSTVILGHLSIFKKSQALSPFESIELRVPLHVSRDVRPPVHIRRGHRSSSRVSTGDSDIPSSCEMKDEPAFKLLQGNPTFFLVIASQDSLHLRQQTQGPSHIRLAEGRFLLSCLWKVGLLLQ